jgi:hypothetical protein
MSGETADKESGWTVDTLHTHFLRMMEEKSLRDEQRYEAQQLALREALIGQEKAVNAALAAAEKAVSKAEVAAEKRFDNVNEFRGQLADQAATFMPRNEAQVLITALAKDVDLLKLSDSQNRGKATGTDKTIAYMVTAVSVLVAVVSLLIKFTSGGGG